MRWHVELNENGTTLRTEHVEDVGLARDTAAELARTTHGGRKAVPEEQLTKVVGQLTDADFADAEPGQEWTYDIEDGLRVTVAALAEADTDEDCWKCGAGE